MMRTTDPRPKQGPYPLLLVKQDDALLAEYLYRWYLE